MRILILTLLAAAAVHAAAPKSVLGTVAEFKVNTLEIGVQPDSGKRVFLKFGPDTEVLRVAPGERDLSRAEPAKLTNIAYGDRVMVSFVEGMTDARRIVLISADDIARRNEAERLDWRKRGVSGIVTARNNEEITIEIRNMQGAEAAAIRLTDKTKIRRYGPDSVRFVDAEFSSASEIAIGDQVQARGKKRDDGKLFAEDVVFGTFLSKVGLITAINREGSTVEVQDLVTEKPLAIKITADTRLKKLMRTPPQGGQPPAGHGAAPPAGSGVSQILEGLPAGTFDDLKVGEKLIVTSTCGTGAGGVTAIQVLIGADALIMMAQLQAQPGTNIMDAMSRLHGGLMAGPGGLSLPGILQ